MLTSSSSPSTASTPGLSAGRTLSTLTSASVQSSLTPGGPTKPGFYRFVRLLEGLFVGYPCPHTIQYWWRGVLPGVSYSDTLMNAILAKGVVNSMSKDQLMVAGLPTYAIEHYVQSLRQPITDLNDLPILLMVTNLYIEIEWQLSHYQNLDTLVRSTMAILYANRELLWRRFLRNQVFFCVLLEFIRLAGEGPVDSMNVPMYQWEEILKFALKASVELGTSGLMLAEIKVFDLSWRLSRSDFDLSTIGWKMVMWEHTLAQHRKGLAPGSKDLQWATMLTMRFSPLKLFWNACHWHFYSNQYCFNMLRATLEYNTRRFEQFCQRESTLKGSKSPFFNILVYSDMLPRVVYHTWYSRDQELCRRVVAALSTFKSLIAYYDDVISYLETLVNTEFGTFTELEVAYFGTNLPFLLKRWQIVRLTDQLATSGFARTMQQRESSSLIVRSFEK
ncbi:MAG: hypothetical protein GOMPHAMPRED_001085 [Gomphillus americanus]|uniref:Uncharacterized protein n=1 Tax=Gomphillus americanus TaxID=1940652 RepID=A0A8H3IFJ7_9LECA|nr:MAG: hypothetical protein GOMPHAMPRED_001085 [Gomphillus americanus]